ncbi:hypothetical protein J7M23_10455 [Candidatus Sumerlaeota bacterium]|nr:hypothetical protein [Candidatus Sumerlaeota bacterium]
MLKNRRDIIQWTFMILLSFLVTLSNAQKEGAKKSPLPAAAEKAGKQENTQLSPQPRLVNIILNQGKIEQALAMIKEQTGINVIAKGRAAGQRIDIIAQNEPIETVLEKICSPRKWVYHKVDETTYEIMDEQTYREQVLPKQVQRKTFQLKYIKATEAQKAVQGVITKGIGSVAVDERTNKLFVTDLPQVLELVTRLLEEIDVRLVTRVFYIKHADIKQIADKIQVYKSPPGIIESDPKTHQIIVTDTFENIKRMEMLIDVLDIGPELKTYDINNLGIDGKLAKEIEDAIKEIVTEGAFWRLNVNTGKLIVEDMPEVHEKIEKLLKALDTPLKQVLIEAELVETNLSRVLKYDIDYQFSYDLGEGEFVSFPPDVPRLASFNVTGTGLSLDILSKHLQAAINTSVSRGESRVLLQPRLIVRNGESAKVFVGGREPYLTTFIGEDRNWDRTYTQNYVTIGLELELTPMVSNRGLIELKINISNKSAQIVERPWEDKTYSLVKTFDQKTETVLMIPSGETRVIGGLVKTEASETKSGVPYLSEIPVIGPILFGSRETNDTKRDVLFFVTPTIVEERGRMIKIIDGKLVEEAPPEVSETPTPEEQMTTPTMPLESLEVISTPTQNNLLVSRPPSELPELKEVLTEEKPAAGYTPLIGAPTGTIGGSVPTPAPAVRTKKVPPEIAPPGTRVGKRPSRRRPPPRVPPPETKY